MYIVGITGGIGSGKSAVTTYLESLGIKIVDADIVAREVVAPGEPALEKIAEHFGEAVISTDGSLDRAELRKEIFSNTEERKWLEGLLHPIIRERIISQLNNANSHYVVLASPLLLETDQIELVNHIVVIDVNEQIQLERTMKRDNNSETQVKAIIAAQMSRSKRRELADTVLTNNTDIETLHKDVDILHQDLLQHALRSEQ